MKQLTHQNKAGIYLCALIVAAAVGCSHPSQTLVVPNGWYVTNESLLYEAGVDASMAFEGKKVATIRSINNEVDTAAFGSLAQYASPAPYLGQRIRLSGMIKTDQVQRMAGLWMRIDQPDSMRMQYFDNMNNRGATATTPWNNYEIVLDVPANAKALAFGGLLVGAGQMWFGNLRIDIVGTDVPTTGTHTGTYALDDVERSAPDTVDYRHLDKVSLEQQYKANRYSMRGCVPQAISYVREITNLGFDQ